MKNNLNHFTKKDKQKFKKEKNNSGKNNLSLKPKNDNINKLSESSKKKLFKRLDKCHDFFIHNLIIFDI